MVDRDREIKEWYRLIENGGFYVTDCDELLSDPEIAIVFLLRVVCTLAMSD